MLDDTFILFNNKKMDIRVKDKTSITEIEAEDITHLLYTIWGDKKKNFNLSEALVDYTNRLDLPLARAILIFEDDILVAHALIGQRQIETNKKVIDNMFLAGVCVNSGFRGKSYGKILVQKALELAESTFDCCIFQTCIPNFYKKLGCSQITNKFINSTNTEHPQ